MSDIQIPNLPAATDLTGAEQLEIVQAGVSRRATIAQIIVDAQVPTPSDTPPLMDGGASAGGQLTYSRGDHVHPHDTSLVAKSGDVMTGDLEVSHDNWPGIGVNYTDSTGAAFYLKAQGSYIWDMSANYPDNDFVISRYEGTPDAISSPLVISHETGTTTLTGVNAQVNLTGGFGGLYVTGSQWSGLYLLGTDNTAVGITFGNGPVGSFKRLWELWPEDPVIGGGTGDFSVWRYDDANVLLGTPITISHADGSTTLTGAAAHVKFTDPSSGMFVGGDQWPGLYLHGTDGTSPGVSFGTGPADTFKRLWEIWPDDPVAAGGTGDFNIQRFGDTDNFLDRPFSISHADGTTTLNGGLVVNGLATINLPPGDDRGVTVSGEWPNINLTSTAGGGPWIAFTNGSSAAWSLWMRDADWPSQPNAFVISNDAYGPADPLAQPLVIDPITSAAAFSVSPTAPTPATADNSTKLATTAFIKAQGYSPGPFGTMATQNANAVAITGGAINGTTIGATTPSTGAFTNLSASSTVSGAGFTTLLAPYALTTAIPVASSTNPTMNGAVAIGVGTTWARADHVHPVDTSRYAATNPSGYQTAAQVTAALAPYATTASLGTMSTQNATTVAITGGAINGTTIGATTAAAGTFTNLSASGTVSGAGFTTLLSTYAKIDSQAFTGTPSLPTGATAVTQTAADSSTKLATTAFVKAQSYLTANQSITLSGDVTGSGATAITATVARLQGRPLSAALPATGNLMGWNGSTWLPVAAGAATAGGTTGQIQYNNGGVLGGISQNGSGNVVMTTGAAAVSVSNNLTIASTAGNSTLLIMNKVASGNANIIYGQTAGSLRWTLALGDSGAEAGSNAGSDFGITRCTDAGAGVDVPLTISRASGVVTLIKGLVVTGTGVNTNSITIDAGTLATTAGSAAMPLELVVPDGNSDHLQTILTRNTTGSAWDSASWKIKRNVDGTVMGYIEFGRQDVKPLSFGLANTEFAYFESTGAFTIKNASPALYLNKASGAAGGNQITGFTAGFTRWNILLGDSAAESTGNVGSNFGLARYTDAGAYIDTPFQMLRSTGTTYFSQTINAQGGVNIQYADPVILMNKSGTGHANNIYGQSANNVRWGLTLGDGSAESTGNAGSDFDIARFNDAGGFIDNVFTINRASGLATFSKTLTSGNHTINGAAASIAAMYLNKPASGQQSTIYGQNNGLQRWGVALGDAAAESTGNLGSNFAVNRYNDAGTYVDAPLQISRSTGQMELAGNLIVKGGAAVVQPAAAGDAIVFLNKSGSTRSSAIYGQTGSVPRWIVTLGDASAESGSNAGSHFTISRCNDAGTYVDAPLQINRTNAVTTFSQPIVNGSDIALKENISSITDALAKVLKLDGVAYNQRGSKRRDIGLVAQAVKKVVPEVVFNVPSPTDPDKEVLGIAYSQLVGLLINAVKELNAKVEALEAKQ